MLSPFRPVLVAACVMVLLYPAARAEVPLEEYVGDGVRLLVLNEDAETGQWTGTIEFKGSVYPFTATAYGDDRARGTFTADGHAYDFTAAWDDDDNVTFQTGSKSYSLKFLDKAPPTEGGTRQTLTLGAKDDAAYRDLQKASKAYSDGDYATAFEIIRPLAERGHIGACFMMGLNSQYGKADAADPAQAVAWYRKAAQAEHMGALYNLQGLVRTGEGSERDVAEANDLMRRACKVGHPDAQKNFGAAIVTGDIPAQPYVEGLAWMMLAAENDDESAANNLRIATRDSTPEQIAEAKQMVEDTLRPLIEKNRGSGDLLLGYHYYITTDAP